jgi:hypothetical protein
VTIVIAVCVCEVRTPARGQSQQVSGVAVAVEWKEGYVLVLSCGDSNVGEPRSNPCLVSHVTLIDWTVPTHGSMSGGVGCVGTRFWKISFA